MRFQPRAGRRSCANLISIYSHHARFFWSPRLTSQNFSRYVELENRERWVEEETRPGKPYAPIGGQVVAARQIIDTRAQSSPEALCLAVITPFPHHLINSARAVHDLLHLHFGLQIIRRRIELAPQTVCRAIQIVHGLLEVVF